MEGERRSVVPCYSEQRYHLGIGRATVSRLRTQSMSKRLVLPALVYSFNKELCRHVQYARLARQKKTEIATMLNILARLMRLRYLARVLRNPVANWPFLALTVLGWLANRRRRR